MTVVYLVLVAAGAVLALIGVFLLVRAVVTSREEGPPAWWAVLLAAAAMLAVPGGAIAAYLLLPAPVSERSLTNSIQRETGSASYSSFRNCSEVGDGRWRCSVRDSSGSGIAEYVVRTGRSCWLGRRTVDGEAPMPRRPEGCIKLRDAVGFF